MLFLDNKYLERKRVGRIAEKRGEQSGGLPDGGMIVLMDLEWLEQEDMHLTQLAAVRVTDGWDVADRLEAIVCPPKACLEQTGHMAFGGYSPDEIAGGISEEICRRMLCGWLTEDDTVIVWAESNRKYLRQLSRIAMSRTSQSPESAPFLTWCRSSPHKEVFRLEIPTLYCQRWRCRCLRRSIAPSMT